MRAWKQMLEHILDQVQFPFHLYWKIILVLSLRKHWAHSIGLKGSDSHRISSQIKTHQDAHPSIVSPSLWIRPQSEQSEHEVTVMQKVHDIWKQERVDFVPIFP